MKKNEKKCYNCYQKRLAGLILAIKVNIVNINNNIKKCKMSNCGLI